MWAIQSAPNHYKIGEDILLRQPERWVFEINDDNKGNQDINSAWTEIFIEKWSNLIARGDPYYNPNLSLESYMPIPKIDEPVRSCQSGEACPGIPKSGNRGPENL